MHPIKTLILTWFLTVKFHAKINCAERPRRRKIDVYFEEFDHGGKVFY